MLAEKTIPHRDGYRPHMSRSTSRLNRPHCRHLQLHQDRYLQLLSSTESMARSQRANPCHPLHRPSALLGRSLLRLELHETADTLGLERAPTIREIAAAASQEALLKHCGSGKLPCPHERMKMTTGDLLTSGCLTRGSGSQIPSFRQGLAFEGRSRGCLRCSAHLDTLDHCRDYDRNQPQLIVFLLSARVCPAAIRRRRHKPRELCSREMRATSQRRSLRSR